MLRQPLHWHTLEPTFRLPSASFTLEFHAQTPAFNLVFAWFYVQSFSEKKCEGKYLPGRLPAACISRRAFGLFATP
jgi:hypothetical protein